MESIGRKVSFLLLTIYPYFNSFCAGKQFQRLLIYPHYSVFVLLSLFETGFPTGLRLVKWTKLAGQKTQRIDLFLPLHLWGYKYALPCLDCLCGFCSGDQGQVFAVLSAELVPNPRSSFLPTIPIPAKHSFRRTVFNKLFLAVCDTTFLLRDFYLSPSSQLLYGPFPAFFREI